MNKGDKRIRLAIAIGLLIVATGFVAFRLLGGPGGPSKSEVSAEQKAAQLVEEAAKQPDFVKTMPDPVEKPPPGKNRAPTSPK